MTDEAYLHPVIFKYDRSREQLTDCGTLNPVKIQLSLKAEPPSTASITIPENDPDIIVGMILGLRYPVRSRVDDPDLHNTSDFDDLFMVTKINTDYNNGRLRTLTCVHIWQKLQEVIIPQKATPSKMGGSTTKVSCLKTLQYIFQRDDDTYANKWGLNWRLGNVDTEYQAITQGWHFENFNLADAIGDVLSCLKKPQISFRYATGGTRISGDDWDYEGAIYVDILRQPTEPTCELRETRNIKSLQVSVDRGKMYNILYPFGKNNYNIKSTDPASYAGGDIVHVKDGVDVHSNSSVETWGAVMVIKTNSTISNRDALRDWAAAELEQNCTPAITITVDALQLATATGCSWDVLRPGTVCRIPLPQYGVTFQDRIVSADYADLCADPYSCKLTLSNDRDTVATVLYKLSGGGGSGKKKTDTNNEADHCDLHDATVAAQSTASSAQSTANATANNNHAKVAGYETSWVNYNGMTILCKR